MTDADAPVKRATARLIWDGSAIELESDSGTTRQLRRCDLEYAWPETPLGSVPRWRELEVDGNDLLLRRFDGVEERVRPSDIAATTDSTPSLVVHGCGQLMGDPESSGLGLIRDGAVICGRDRVLWSGPESELSSSGLDTRGATKLDAEGRLVTPGLVDCHNHLVFAGNRADEFTMRAAGSDYQQIASAGGGIRATLEPTRAASFDTLLGLAASRATRALAHGSTTIEAKSGYALTFEGELRLLRVARCLNGIHPVHVSPTLLGAHVLAPEYGDDGRADYVTLVCSMVDAAAREKLATAVDVYCDQGAFTLDEMGTIMRAASAVGLDRRAHVGQFADLGGPAMLAKYGGRSGDHLERISPAGIAAMAAAKVTAVMLPGACVQLAMTPPPVAALRDAGVAMAVATDLNPGTSNSESLPLQMWLATTHYGMTVEEAWRGVTRSAAAVLNLPAAGHLLPGGNADLVLWDAEQPGEIPYHYGVNLVHRVVKAGRPLARASTTMC